MNRYHVEDGEEVLHVGCCNLIADQVRGLKALDVTQLIAAAMRSEGRMPRTNGELVQRLIDLIADTIEMYPHSGEATDGD